MQAFPHEGKGHEIQKDTGESKKPFDRDLDPQFVDHIKQKSQSDISVVHDLAEHISEHAKQCEVFLKDTKDQDLKELSEHLKEIDEKVHKLSDHVRYVEDKLIDEYERLGLAILPQDKGQEAS